MFLWYNSTNSTLFKLQLQVYAESLRVKLYSHHWPGPIIAGTNPKIPKCEPHKLQQDQTLDILNIASHFQTDH